MANYYRDLRKSSKENIRKRMSSQTDCHFPFPFGDDGLCLILDGTNWIELTENSVSVTMMLTSVANCQYREEIRQGIFEDICLEADVYPDNASRDGETFHVEGVSITVHFTDGWTINRIKDPQVRSKVLEMNQESQLYWISGQMPHCYTYKCNWTPESTCADCGRQACTKHGRYLDEYDEIFACYECIGRQA